MCRVSGTMNRIFGHSGAKNGPNGPGRALWVPCGAVLSCHVFGFASFKVGKWGTPGGHPQSGKSGKSGVWVAPGPPMLPLGPWRWWGPYMGCRSATNSNLSKFGKFGEFIDPPQFG